MGYSNESGYNPAAVCIIDEVNRVGWLVGRVQLGLKDPVIN